MTAALHRADTLPQPALPLTGGRGALSGRDLVDWVRLCRSHRVGAVTFRRLLAEYGTATAALAALPDIAERAGVKAYSPCSWATAQAELRAGAAAGAVPLPICAPAYPARLADIPDPPPVLWARGDLGLLDRPAVALVGARNASALGRRMAARLARELGEAGLVVVSGLARGIDAAAHEAALPSGTVAVFAGGVDVVYPQEHAALADRILSSGGLLLSEMPPGLAPQARHFPRRNRIISGLSDGLVVVEGATKSGSLITASNALDQGREVMAIPGHPFDARAGGCNTLIRDGATLVRNAQDIVAVLGRGAAPAGQAAQKAQVAAPPPEPQQPQQARARAADPPVGEIAHRILNLLGPAPVSEDILIRQLELPAPLVLAALAELDLDGRIDRHPGGQVSFREG